MKGCLKQPSPIPSPALDCPHGRKCVAFEADGSEKVFFADEWDRTPTEPTRKLSYQDLMELKEIQRSLPLANQPPDPILGRPGRHYLSTVPIGLLPLLPQADATSVTQCSPQTTPHVSPTNYNLGLTSLLFQRNIIASRSRSPPRPRSHPPTHPKISNPTAQRLRPNFAFLPLLDTPTSSEDLPSLPSNPSSRSQSPEQPSDTDQSLDPPTPSLTNASLDSSPLSRASSSSPEPTFLQLPPKHISAEERYHDHKLHFGPRDSYFPIHTSEFDVDEGSNTAHSFSRRHFNEPSTFLHPFRQPSSSTHREDKPIEPPNCARKRNVIVVNDIEIELDDDEKDDEPSPAPAIGTSSSSGTSGGLDHQLRRLSVGDTRHPNCPKNLKPPETKPSFEIKASSPSSSNNCAQVVGGFGLHVPLRFKRCAPCTDTSKSDIPYTGRS